MPPFKKDYSEDFSIKLNKKNASLIIVALAFVTRLMYYGEVEKVTLWDYFKKEEFYNTFHDLRFIMLYLDAKSEAHFENYINFELNDWHFIIGII